MVCGSCRISAEKDPICSDNVLSYRHRSGRQPGNDSARSNTTAVADIDCTDLERLDRGTEFRNFLADSSIPFDRLCQFSARANDGSVIGFTQRCSDFQLSV